jgi:hypothetical protein
VTAVPSEGCSFEKWSGDIGDNEAGNISINVVMDTDRTITADFTGCPGPHNITISYSTYSSGGDTINASFGSLTWSADRTTSGTTVNVTAVAAKGYRFDGWQGAINGSQETISFVADSSEPVTARFSKISQSPWPWAIVGFAFVLLIGVLIYKFIPVKKKGRKDTHTDAASPPQPPQPQPPQPQGE